ncbi:MAG: hypothetical protein [Arlivirus sp. XZN142933]|nr:MAG: hypothetical protein [Arlivirus sp. XZN142933]
MTTKKQLSVDERIKKIENVLMKFNECLSQYKNNYDMIIKTITILNSKLDRIETFQKKLETLFSSFIQTRNNKTVENSKHDIKQNDPDRSHHINNVEYPISNTLHDRSKALNNRMESYPLYPYPSRRPYYRGRYNHNRRGYDSRGRNPGNRQPKNEISDNKPKETNKMSEDQLSELNKTMTVLSQQFMLFNQNKLGAIQSTSKNNDLIGDTNTALSNKLENLTLEGNPKTGNLLEEGRNLDSEADIKKTPETQAPK